MTSRKPSVKKLAAGKPTGARRLHRGHFAFMRALAQGLDERASWERYLRMEGEGADLRTIRKTIAWIRDEFAAAARREKRPGTAKLILLDPQRFSAAPTLPSLADFAAERGLEDFSEDEQIEAYEAAYPHARDGASTPASGGRGAGQGARSLSRRARLIEHQLEALRWLQDLVVRDPQPGDPVGAWIAPALAPRLRRAGLTTLSELVDHINAAGARWWVPVRGVGERKAARIVEWLRAHESVLGRPIGPHALRPRTQVASAELEAVVPRATALVPLEKFVPPAELDGRAGRLRADPQHCLLMARNDYEAVGAWLAAKAPSAGTKELSATQRAYRKEAERLLLWATLERGKAMSSLSVEDALAFRDFLANPPPEWCGPRHQQRWSPRWRPLEGPLSASALRQSMVIVRGLFSFLVDQGYLVGNPFAALARVPPEQRALGSSRALSFEQWDRIERLLSAHDETDSARRLRRAMRWLYATGLRVAEMTAVTCGNLEPVNVRTPEVGLAPAWMLHVVGKGDRTRQVPVPPALVEELSEELARNGFAPQVDAMENRGIAILARFETGQERPAPWSASGLYQAIKAFMSSAGVGLESGEAARMRQASPHWLRHSHGSHALQGRPGQPAVPLQVVQNNLGHASIATTSVYLTTERDARIQAMQGFWGESFEEGSSKEPRPAGLKL